MAPGGFCLSTVKEQRDGEQSVNRELQVLSRELT